MFIGHGLPKMMAGSETWGQIGGAMANIGINFLPEFWGFMAAFSELFGGIFLLLGLLFRPANALLAFTMLIAAVMHFKSGDGFGGWAHPIESAILFISLIFIGPGIYSLDEKFSKKKD